MESKFNFKKRVKDPGVKGVISIGLRRLFTKHNLMQLCSPAITLDAKDTGVTEMQVIVRMK